MSGSSIKKTRKTQRMVKSAEAAAMAQRQSSAVPAEHAVRIPNIPTEVAKAFPREITLRGKTHMVLPETDSVAVPLLCALLALEDPRIDAVLTAFKVKVVDVKGQPIFPEA